MKIEEAGVWVSSCPDKGILRDNPITGEAELCEGFFVQVYDDEGYDHEIDNFCLAIGHEIPDGSDRALEAGIRQYLTPQSFQREVVLRLPCTVGDTVWCNIDGHKEDYLDECIVKEISIEKDRPEPLFTVVNYEKAEYATFWQSDFGKEIFNTAQYLGPSLHQASDEESEVAPPLTPEESQYCVQELTLLKEELRGLMNTRLARLLSFVETRRMTEQPQTRVISLAGHTNLFKGKKPVSVTLPDGVRLTTPTWKQAVLGIMHDCISNENCYVRLMEMRDKVQGKQRVILAASPDGMDAPLKLADDLYLESKFDTETLLNVLTERVLKPAGYDYSQVQIEFSSPTQAPSEEQERTASAQPSWNMGQLM